ncbi:hypothetical protein, partial [Phocaeicola plebeius]
RSFFFHIITVYILLSTDTKVVIYYNISILYIKNRMIFDKRLKISRNPVGQEEKTQLCGVSSCYSYSTA